MIVLAYDHRAYELFGKIRRNFEKNGIEYKAFCSETLDNLDSVAEYVKEANKLVKKGNIGIYGCGSGIAASIAANRSKGIRGALCVEVGQSEHARANDDCNVLILPAEFVCYKRSLRMIETFLNTKFLGGKYTQRTEFLDTIN